MTSHLPASDRRRRLTILCDFDGTLCPVDTTDALLARHADAAWTEVEAAWEQGEIDAFTCMREQVALLRANAADIGRLAGELRLDPHARSFAAACREAGAELVIVSDGLADLISPLLAQGGLDVPLRANRLASAGDGWMLDTPFRRVDCQAGAGHCKCAALDPGPGHQGEDLVVVIGDGRSDLCVARRADLVLARDGESGPSTLLTACRREGLAHVPFRDFRDVLEALAPWLSAGEAAA
jgi:HAD superfamily phosphoserine phosphatase-like hydrolase